MLIEKLNRVAKSETLLFNAAPRVLCWPAALIVWGPGFFSVKHKHHSVKLVMAIEGELRIRRGPPQKWTECRAALVKADAPHEVDASNTQVFLAFVDPESDLGAALLERLNEDITPIKDDTVASWRRHLGDPANLTSAQVEPCVRNSHLSNRRTPRLHPKAARTLQVIREDLGTYQGLSRKTYGGDSRAVRIVFYAHFHRISRRSAATLHPLATPAARCRRDHERRHGDASSASCRLDVPHSQPEESNCFG